jgi:DNA-binding Lrp family transcriptional regulator
MVDEIDKQIAFLLLNNGRMSLQDLSDKLGITRTAVKKRMDKLIEVGVIESFNLRLSMAMTNSELLFAFLSFIKKPSEKTEDVILNISEQIMQVNRTLDDRIVVFAEYTSSEELSEITNSFWKLENISEVETHTNFIHNRGGKIDLTKIHKRVLKSLLDNPRKSISEVAKETGLTARRINKTIDELQDKGAVLFSIRMKFNIAGETMVFTRVRYDPSKTTFQEFSDWVNENLGYVFITYISASEPLLFFFFYLDHFSETDKITSELKKTGSINSVDHILMFPGKKGHQPRTLMLERLVTESDT